MRIIFIFLFVIGYFLADGQNARDTLRLSDVLDLVNAYHPVARQAALFQETGAARVLAAKGGFDPQLSTDFNQKYSLQA